MQKIDAYWKWWYATETGEEWGEPQWDRPSKDDLFTESLQDKERREV